MHPLRLHPLLPLQPRKTPRTLMSQVLKTLRQRMLRSKTRQSTQRQRPIYNTSIVPRHLMRLPPSSSSSHSCVNASMSRRWRRSPGRRRLSRMVGVMHQTSDLSACPLIFIHLGTHPESSHLHSELSRRRDKRIELAERRRNYEVGNILKRRRAEENSVWSWWMVRFSSVRPLALCDDYPTQLARDELQTTMIAETNRKRRKLERDRRAAERPQPGKSTMVLCNYLYRVNFK